MKTAVVIDDQDHALKQIETEFPKEKWKDYNFIHFDTYELFSKQKLNEIDIVFLDFFLSKDRIYGLDILPNLHTKILVCFSSKKEMSDAMADAAVKNHGFHFKDVYSVKKLKDTLENQVLSSVLEEITNRLNDE